MKGRRIDSPFPAAPHCADLRAGADKTHDRRTPTRIFQDCEAPGFCMGLADLAKAALRARLRRKSASATKPVGRGCITGQPSDKTRSQETETGCDFERQASLSFCHCSISAVGKFITDRHRHRVTKFARRLQHPVVTCSASTCGQGLETLLVSLTLTCGTGVYAS